MTKAAEHLKNLSDDDLVLAASGAIDLNELAHQELARRGLNTKGQPVGLAAAYNDWFDAYGSPDGSKAWCSGCNEVLLPVGSMCERCETVNVPAAGGEA